MSVVDFKRMTLIGVKSEKRELLKLLHKLGCYEVDTSSFNLEKKGDVDEKYANEVRERIEKLNYILDLYKNISVDVKKIEKSDKEFKPNFYKRSFVNSIPIVEFDEFYEIVNDKYEVFDKIDYLQEIEKRILENRSEIAKRKNLIAQIQPFRSVDLPLSEFRDTRNTSINVGLISNLKLDLLDKLEKENPNVVIHKYESTGIQTPVVVIVHKEDKQDILQQLSNLDYVINSFKTHKTSAKKIEQFENEISDLEVSIVNDIKEIMTFTKHMEEFRLYFDFYSVEEKKLNLSKDFANTDSTYILQAWVPSEEVEKTDEVLKSTDLLLAYEYRDVLDGETPPTLVKSSALVDPYQSVTNMLAAPRYKEFDPNAFVAFFFFLMAGMMLADFGYGVILALSTAIILVRVKPEKGEMRLVKLICMMGISTMIWGALFGSYFGVTYKPILFSPLENPLGMLFIGLGFGVIQLLVGIAIKSYILIAKEKNILQGIFNFMAWFGLVFGVGFIFLANKTIGKISLPASLKTVGMVVAIMGIVSLMITGMFAKKGFAKIAGAFGSLYGIVNFFSDVMSYARLFGLGLASAVIGYVFNEIARVFIDLIPYAGWVIGIAFAIVGHIFNIAINTLGTYVHDARLQFVEFFGKFYEGGGRIFAPLGKEVKYNKIKVKND